jgi:hypothetical protein
MSSSTLSSLALPALLSCLGLAATQAWYLKMATKPSKTTSSGPALAILDSKTDVIERRPTSRIIWENLGEGEQLFNGEAVRTSANASGEITFIQSGMAIKLEPDSLVIIEETQGKLQLNLVNGGVFVKTEVKAVPGVKKPSADQLILKAGNQKIELAGGKSSAMNLSVSESGSANIQVTKGEVKVAGAAGKVETIAEGKSKAVSITETGPAVLDVQGPSSGATIPLTSLGSVMKLGWSNPPVGSVIFFESGSSRDSLKRQAVGVPAELKMISATVAAGEFFWRLVAVNAGKVVAIGATYFNTGLVLDAPKLLANASAEKIVMKESNPVAGVRVAWTLPQGSDGVNVYLSTDAAFKSIVSQNKFATDSDWALSINKPGKYYWRVIASWPGIAQQLSSSVGSFEVSLQKEYPVPVLASPEDGAVFVKTMTDSKGLPLTWNQQQGVDSYTITIEQGTGDTFALLNTKTSNTAEVRLAQLPAGVYRWSVQAKIGEETSKFSAGRTVKIIEMARLSLKNPAIETTPLVYESATAPISIALTPAPASAKSIRFRVGEARQDLKALPWQVSPINAALTFKLAAAGHYVIVAEALDASKKVVAMSDTFKFELKAPDKLPPPALLTGLQPLTTGEAGDITLKWNQVPGAVRYMVEISGKTVPVRKAVTTTSFKISGLNPGDYSLIITAFDKSGRAGVPSTPVNLIVPNVSNISAPTSKGIRIR